MTMDQDLAFDPLAGLTEADRTAIRALSQAVYPPAEAADWPGRSIEGPVPNGAPACGRLTIRWPPLWECYCGRLLTMNNP
jgi:hypothetical protein